MKTTTIRLTNDQRETLEILAKLLGVSGQRGATLQPLIHFLAEVAAGAMAETVAALGIADGCASGEDWDELIEIIRPHYTK